MRLVKSEFLKLVTTNAWWLFALGAFGLWALTFLINAVSAHFTLTQPPPEGMNAEQTANFVAQQDVIFQAANLFTSGQFFGLMFVMLVGIVLVTNEFQHQTATATFLAAPHRTAVILAKLLVAAVTGIGFWAVTTALNIPATIIFLNTEHVANHLGDPTVVRAILLNGLAYLLWGILGVGIGVLIRSQIGATVTAVTVYLIGTAAAGLLFTLVANWLNEDWIEKIQYGLPSIASGLMVAGKSLPNQPAFWVGAIVLVTWSLVTGAIGTAIIRVRDIS